MITWFDITNTPQVHFLLAIRNVMKDLHYDSFIYTARDFSETAKMLAQEKDLSFQLVGGYHGKSILKKSLGLFSRFIEIHRLPINYDLSVSCGSESAIWSTWLKNKRSIAFGDNDTAQQWTYAPVVHYAFFPNAIPLNRLENQGLKGKLYLYNGYKEDIYLSFFCPDKSFFGHLPFKHYVLIRPENIQARYIKNGKVKSIVPVLLKKLSSQGYNILYLPRYETDRKYAEGCDRVFTPDKPLNGLDACYHADAVLTGAGTLAREAACLGVPAFSFYAGKELLAVDQKMIRDGWMIYSRDADELIQAVKSTKRRDVDLTRSKAVQQEVKDKLREILKGMEL